MFLQGISPEKRAFAHGNQKCLLRRIVAVYNQILVCCSTGCLRYRPDGWELEQTTNHEGIRVMSATITLPFWLRLRLTALRWRIRLLQAVGSFAMLVVVLGFSAPTAVLADRWLDLPAQTRQFVFLAWLAVGIAWLARSVAVPLCRRIDASTLAAVIEEKYPDLGERLSSAVELVGKSAEGHGSPLFIALMLEETAARCEGLDFRSAVPARRAVIRASLAATMVLLLAAPALFWPQQYGEWAQRFFRPWIVAPVEAPVDIAQTQSEIAVPPVELAADSPIITITPPAYARSVKEEETFHGLVDLSPLQYSEIRFDFRFTRPAVAAYLEHIAPGLPGESASPASRGLYVLYPLTLSADRQGASLTIPAIEDGKYRLILEAEHQTRTELLGGSIHVQLDQPPSVRRFSGKEYMRSLLPYERIPFEIEAADDIGVSAIELEYRVNDGEAVRQPLEFEGGNTPSALSRHVLGLAGKVREDDRFCYRFYIRDNLPKEYKGPHVVVYPPDRWLTVRIARRGDPLQEQEILTQRDEINRRLQAIRESLLRERHGVSQVKQEASSQTFLPPDRLDRIQQLHRENQSNQKALREVAQLAEASTGETPAPPLQPIAELTREVADQEMHKSQLALDRVPQEEAPTDQVRQLKAAEQQLGSAVKRLEELKKMNDRLAQERLDRIKLEMLAEREKHLAEKTADLAAKHPVLDPKARELAEKIKGEQAQVASELERLAQRNELLKQALQQAQTEQAQKLAERALELAQSERDLAQAQAETEQKRKAAGKQRPVVSEDPIEELARRQRELAKKIAEMARTITKDQGEKAAISRQAQQAVQAAEETARQMQTGTLPQARQAGEKTAEQLRQLASELAHTSSRNHWQGFDPFLMPHMLRRGQLDINRRLQMLESDPRAMLAHQRTQQRNLQQETLELSQQFQRLAQEARSFAPMQSALQRAAGNSQQAQQAMQQARDHGQRDEAPAEKQAQERAAQFLEQSAQAVSEAARSQAARANEGQPLRSDRSKAGEAAVKAGQQMAQAQGRLNRGQAAQAQSAMQQAAGELAQAAQHMAALPMIPQSQQGMPAKQAGLGRQAGGLPDLSAYGLDKAAYAGKSWGELPGELRTKIVQDMKARYGEDYARMIKSYFEQIADTKKKFSREP
jgi:hypothetical protein